MKTPDPINEPVPSSSFGPVAVAVATIGATAVIVGVAWLMDGGSTRRARREMNEFLGPSR